MMKLLIFFASYFRNFSP